MKFEDHIKALYSSTGKLHSVHLSAELWLKGGDKLEKHLLSLLEQEEKIMPEPLEDWELFKSRWDFKYPYNAQVECPSCGADTDDWTLGAERPFLLKSAQLSGLAVFHCKGCGATVRKRHFKDHCCFDFTAGAI